MTALPRRIQLFGVNGRTGRYALPSLSSDDLEVAARHAIAPPQLVADARRSLLDREVASFEGVLGPASDACVRDGRKRSPGADLPEWEIAQRGWGVVFPAGDGQTPAIREALSPLFALRRSQVGAVSERHFRELEYRPGELLFEFRRRNRATPGIADPKKIPGYLLLVGGPQAIPFDFQTELAAQEYAVGRIDFESIEGYARYAESVVRAERAVAPVETTRRIAFFAPRHPDDPLSEESSQRLAAPLADACALPGDGWTVERILGERATKHRFAELLARASPPAILFTAGHGAVFESGDERQAAHQGALVCADWQGPEAAAISESDYFSADDLPAETRLREMIAFHFACCSLGVPAQNELHLAGLPIPEWLAPLDLVARLPQRMLTQGALAAIGHLDLVFAYSFREGRDEEDACTDPPLLYDRCLKDLLRGRPVGEAMSPFRACYQARLVERAELVQRAHDKVEVAADTLWEVEAACHDARYYAVFGDPAVRLAAPVETAP
ncbi:MAG TPA: hypothetical protein VN851_18470 [Thermoanaerobaculia bacterium]|nr:hypothetical protein [Thermoanaerobaculia bacterium]